MLVNLNWRWLRTTLKRTRLRVWGRLLTKKKTLSTVPTAFSVVGKRFLLNAQEKHEVDLCALCAVLKEQKQESKCCCDIEPSRSSSHQRELPIPAPEERCSKRTLRTDYNSPAGPAVQSGTACSASLRDRVWCAVCQVCNTPSVWTWGRGRKG